LTGEGAQYVPRDCRSYLEGIKPIISCNGELLRQLLEAGTNWLEKNRDSINALNIFPVPDGDTGTNMLLTMRSALQELTHTTQKSVGAVIQMVSRGALMGARGNSGVIFSQLLRGLAKSLGDKDEFGAQDFAAALVEASATAYKAVMKPIEGTILTVAKDAAEAAVAAAKEFTDIGQILCSVVEAARISVQKTPSLLPVLAEAGVVDAGGQGLFIFLEGMLRHLKGEMLELETARPSAQMLWTMHPEGESEYGYEVMYLLQGTGLNTDAIRQTLSTIGNSVVVVGDENQVRVHVHTEEPGAPLTYGVSLGALSNIVVENLQLQTEQLAAQEMPNAAATARVAAHKGDIAIVAVSPGQGISRVFESLGASIIVPGGQTMNPSTEQLLRAVDNLTVDQVIILPNNKNILLTAQQVSGLSQKTIRIVGSKSVPQGIAAILAFNYQVDLDTNVDKMEQATKNIQTIEITKAIRTAQINGMRVEAGQAISLCNGKLTACYNDMTEAVKESLHNMNAYDYEIATIYYGEDVTGEEAQRLVSDLQKLYPMLEFDLIQGGQPHYHYIISLE